MDELSDQRDDAEVGAEQGCGGEGVGHAALEDQVGIHQPVADDGPAEGQRKKDQRESSQLGQQARHADVEQERNCVEQSEGTDRQPRAAIQPFELLAEQGRVGTAIAYREQSRGQHVKGGDVPVVDLIQALEQDTGGLPAQLSRDPKTYQRDARRIQNRKEPASSAILQPLLREADGEMQEQSRLQGSCNDVAPKHCLIDEIQLAGVLQRVQSEGNQAEKIEVERARGGPAAKEHVYADGQVDDADEAQTQVRAAIFCLRIDNDWCVQRLSIPRNGVISFTVCAGAIEFALEVREPRYLGTIDRREQVVFVDAR